MGLGETKDKYIRCIMIIQIKIPITEGVKDNTYSTRFRRLSERGQRVLRLMALIYKRSSRTTFDMNDFRGRGLGNWRRVRDTFYELESRQFGKVDQGYIGIEFDAFIPVLQSIG